MKVKLLALVALSIILSGALLPLTIEFAAAHNDDKRQDDRSDSDQMEEDERASVSPEVLQSIASIFNLNPEEIKVLEAEFEDNIWEVEFTNGKGIFEVKIRQTDSGLQLIKSEAEDELDIDEREVNVEKLSANEAVIKLEKKVNEQENEVKIKLETEEETTMTLEFKEETNESEAELKLRIAFDKIIEYKDSNNDGKFDSTDAIVSDFETEELIWEISEPTDVAVNNKTGKRIVATGAIPKSNGKLVLSQTVFGQFVFLGDTSIKPTEMKIDIIFSNYPFSNASNTRLALFVKTTSTAQSEAVMDEGVAEDVLIVSQDQLKAIFSWKNVATADGTQFKVETTTLGSKIVEKLDGEEVEFKQEQRLIFNYQRGAEIVHDPKLGIIISDASPSLLGTTLISIISIITAATALILFRHRRSVHTKFDTVNPSGKADFTLLSQLDCFLISSKSASTLSYLRNCPSRRSFSPRSMLRIVLLSPIISIVSSRPSKRFSIETILFSSFANLRVQATVRLKTVCCLLNLLLWTGRNLY
jgi:frataxin-like iron-binding protein CyaY